jgi:hypothetical protein
LLSELRSLSNRELRLTLRALSPQERAEVLGMLEPLEREESAPAFETLAGLSPWLLKAVDQAKSDGTQSRLTPATRAALLRSLRELPAGGKAEAPGARQGGTFIGRALARRKNRAAGQ